MTTPAHGDFKPDKPDGADNGPTVVDTILANLLALRDSILTGFVKGFVQSRTNGTGTAAQPQFITWYNSGLGAGTGFRWEITWTGFAPTTVVEEWTNDGASSWTTILTHGLTFDGSLNCTACTTGGGAVVVLLEAWAKSLKVTFDLATHAALTGVGAHGLESMSTQSSSAIAVTGGTEDGVDSGQTTPGKGDFKRAREIIANSGSASVVASGGTFTPDLATAAYFKVQPDSTTTNSMTMAAPSNPPSGSRTQTFAIEIVNGRRSGGGAITWDAAYHWIGGSGTKPADTALEVSGSNLFACTWNGSTWDITHRGKRG